MRVGLRLIARQGNLRPAVARDRYVLIPLLAVNRATVDIEVNMVVFNLHERDVRRIARFHSGSPDGQCRLQIVSAGTGHAVLQLDSLRPHRKRGPRIKHLGLKVANDLKPRLTRHVRSVGGYWWSDRSGDWNWAHGWRCRGRLGLGRLVALSADKSCAGEQAGKQEGREPKTYHKAPQGRLRTIISP